MYKIYSKDDCIFCERTLQALKTFELEFKQYKLGKDFTKEDFIGKFKKYGHMSFPAIYKDGVFIGGWEDFKKSVF